MGDLITKKEALAREKIYNSEQRGGYLFLFTWNGKKYCIDATAEDGNFGRLLNHSRDSANAEIRITGLDNTPALYFVAIKDISAGTEIVFDYGERRPDVLRDYPWLQKQKAKV